MGVAQPTHARVAVSSYCATPELLTQLLHNQPDARGRTRNLIDKKAPSACRGWGFGCPETYSDFFGQ
jgi:hypothetical protein